MKNYRVRHFFAFVLCVCLAFCLGACGNGDSGTTGGSVPPPKVTWSEPVWSWGGVTSATATFTSSVDGHTEVITTTDISEEITQALTCSDTGYERYTATVTFNGKQYTDIHIVVIPPSHHFVEPTWVWDGFAASAVFDCTFTGCTYTESCNATVTSEVTTAATCTDAGVRTYTATVTFGGEPYTDTKTEVIPTLAHTYQGGVCTVCGATEEQP